ncbi:MAG: flagellar protein [Allorhizobium sp.]
MTDFDADEPVAPIKPASKGPSSISDRILAATGVVMACAAAFFPWYVFFNEDKFGMHVAAIDHTRDLPEGQARNVFSVSPLAMIDKDDGGAKRPMEPPVDPLVTATVSKLGAASQDGAALKEDQPFPGGGAFRLLHVANGRAMIEDGSGMYMVRIGSILPDNSRVATLEQREGKWVIVTSTGEIYEHK